MNKENVLFGVIGLLAGLIIGFMFANSINTGSMPGTMPGSLSSNSNMPADHPAIPGGPGGQMSPAIQQAIDQANKEPENFEAQLKAAEFYYQIQRYDGAIEFLTKANKLKPEDYNVIVHLGNAYFDSSQFGEAEKWYSAALAKNPDDVNVRTDLGLTFMFRAQPDHDRAIKEFTRSLEIDPNHKQTVQNLTVAYTKKGEAEKARELLAKLETLDPANTSLTQLRKDIDSIATSPK